MFKKIVYVVGAVYENDEATRLKCSKINWMALHSGAEVTVVITEADSDTDASEFFLPRVHVVNLALNFDSLSRLFPPLRQCLYALKYLLFENRMRRLLMRLRPDAVISYGNDNTRFLPRIYDGSFKVVEAHFSVSDCAHFESRLLPKSLCRFVARCRGRRKVRQMKRFDGLVVSSREALYEWRMERCNATFIRGHLWKIPKSPSKCTSKRVLAIGDFDKDCGFERLIRGWKEVSVIHPEWELRLYGNGNPTRCMGLIKKTGMDSWVSCNPLPEMLDRLYMDASIYVQACQHDYSAYHIMEAMSFGLTCLVYIDTYEVMNCIKGDKTGVYMMPLNQIDLSKKLIALIGDERMRKRLGHNARQEAKKRFTTDWVMRRWVTVFEEMDMDALVRSTKPTEDSWYEEDTGYYYRRYKPDTASAQRSPSIAADTMPPA